MKKYKLVGHTEETSIELGVIQADNMYECELFLAINFPQYYFGANITEVLGPNATGPSSFMCICVKEFYTDTSGNCPTPLELALRSFDSDLKLTNGFCTVSSDHDGESYRPLKTLTIPLDTNVVNVGSIPKELITVKEAAKRLGVHPNTVYRPTRAGRYKQETINLRDYLVRENGGLVVKETEI